MPNVNVAGPLTLVHAYDAIVPSASVPVPFNVVLFTGNVNVILLPALAVGGMLAAAFTVTVTSSVAVAPLLSVTVNLNTYTPCTKLVNVVVAALACT